MLCDNLKNCEKICFHSYNYATKGKFSLPLSLKSISNELLPRSSPFVLAHVHHSLALLLNVSPFFTPLLPFIFLYLTTTISTYLPKTLIRTQQSKSQDNTKKKHTTPQRDSAFSINHCATKKNLNLIFAKGF